MALTPGDRWTEDHVQDAVDWAELVGPEVAVSASRY